MPWSNARPRSNDYGWDWSKTRAAWAERHDPDDVCTRCPHPLGPMGPGLHLDHDDNDRSIIRGFAHGDPCPWCGVRCNVRAGAQVGRSRQDQTRLTW